MVAFETTPKEMEQRRKAPAKKRRKYPTRGVVFLGAAAVGVAAFGSIAATIGSGTDADGDDGCCGDDADCDCD